MFGIKSFDMLVEQLETDGKVRAVSQAAEKEFNDYMRESMRINRLKQYQAIETLSNVRLTR